MKGMTFRVNLHESHLHDTSCNRTDFVTLHKLTLFKRNFQRCVGLLLQIKHPSFMHDLSHSVNFNLS